jgi:hypothetical protein
MVPELILHVDALLSAMQSNKDLFAPVAPYVKSLAQAARLPSVEVEKSAFIACGNKIRAFYADYPDVSSTPGMLWIPPAEVSTTRRTALDIIALIEKLTALPDDQFAACFRPIRATAQRGDRKPHPEHVAQVCRNGHLVLGSLQRFPQFRKSFCEDCGAPTIDQCQKCAWPIAGIGPDAWMAGAGPCRPPRFCGECGSAFPWTETALAAAREYTDDLDQLSNDEKASLKEAFTDLTVDTARTPLAVSRFRKFVTKVGPVAGDVLRKIIETVATEAAKKSIGL